VSDPNHVQANFSTSCESCHSTRAWEPATFDHNQTGFVLEGGHRNVDCVDCHTDGYSGTPTECFACHQDDYQSVSDPNHVQANFSTSCESCHTTNAWEPAIFDHNQTGFPLTGGHRAVDCLDCHANGYSGTPTDCYSCHLTDYQGVTNPNHVTAGFSTQCETCHTTTAWDPANFDHNLTAFPLNGAHRVADCLDCHANGCSGTSTACYSCHQSDYQGTTDPDHADAGFSTTCESCHSEQAWEPATFNHDQTPFPLRGEHRNVDCLECHANGYTGTPTDCYSCHANDYNQTNNPNHASAGFPITCENCHDPSDWNDANFDHDGQFFPIYSGNHRNEWNTCDDCHVAPGNFKVFECILCHEHDRSQTDDDHSEVSGYRYQSISCLSCHPDGDN